jgi:N-hydroxyarylamine O-acetyltransferase
LQTQQRETRNVKLETYLRRIAYDGPLEPTLDTLRRLHYAHLLAVPFENLDVTLGVPIALEEEALFDKIVTRERGGFCYELNGLFAALLRELGFKVSLLSARVPIEENHTGPEFDHLALQVELDVPWLADVGFGESFIEPLPILPSAEQIQRDVFFCLDRQEDDRWRVLRYAPPSQTRAVAELSDLEWEWRMLYDFTTTPRQLSDFGPMCLHHQTSPLSHFTRRKIVSRLTTSGRVTLTNVRLIVSEGELRHESLLESCEDYDRALEESFGIRLSKAEAAAR